MEVTQTDKAITLDCGCNVDIIITAYSVSNLAVQSTLSLCPLHRAADDLLAALKRIRKRAETDPTNLPVKMFAGEIVAMCTDAIYAAEEKTS